MVALVLKPHIMLVVAVAVRVLLVAMPRLLAAAMGVRVPHHLLLEHLSLMQAEAAAALGRAALRDQEDQAAVVRVAQADHRQQLPEPQILAAAGAG
jgi:hypothetical protein